MAIEPDRLYKMNEAAEAIGCSRTNLYVLVKRGDIASTSIGAAGKLYRIRGSDITAFLDSRRSGGPEPRTGFKHLARRHASA